MMDDFALFSKGGDADADIALITAYLARELSPLQIAAVQDRLETDIAFREHVGPVIESWVLPGSLRDAVAASAAGGADVIRTSARWRTPMIRIAAVISAIVLPLVAVSQVIQYVANRPAAPGHAAARASAPIEQAPVGAITSSARGPGAIADGPSNSADPAVVPSAPARPQGGPAPRPLGPVIASSTVDLAEIRHVRQLSDGRVLVNDGRKRLVWMLDASLRNPRIVIDSTAGSPNTYGPTSGGLLSALGDTSLFLDRGSQTFLVVDPAGKVVRVMALPPGTTTQLITNLTNPLNGAGISAVSPRYGFVFVPVPTTRPDPPLPAGGGDSVQVVVENTSTLVAMNVESRIVDTVASLSSGTATAFTFLGGRLARAPLVPRMFPPSDEWAVTSDGSIAVLRTREYRVEWFGVDGTRNLSPRLPFPWQVRTDADKRRIVDSANAASKQRYDANVARQRADTTGGRADRTVTADGRVLVTPSLGTQPPTYYDVSGIPDAQSPTFRGARTMVGDGDNNVWIHVWLPGSPVTLQVYDVVNRKGELIDRVQLPDGRTLGGFGAGGVVYLIAQDGGKPVLEKVRFR